MDQKSLKKSSGGFSLLELLIAMSLTIGMLGMAAGQDWKTNRRLADATQAVEGELGKAGRVLIRASGTEPLLRVMVEARDATVAKASAERLAEAARAA